MLRNLSSFHGYKYGEKLREAEGDATDCVDVEQSSVLDGAAKNESKGRDDEGRSTAPNQEPRKDSKVLADHGQLIHVVGYLKKKRLLRTSWSWMWSWFPPALSICPANMRLRLPSSKMTLIIPSHFRYFVDRVMNILSVVLAESLRRRTILTLLETRSNLHLKDRTKNGATPSGSVISKRA